MNLQAIAAQTAVVQAFNETANEVKRSDQSLCYPTAKKPSTGRHG